ncbi:MAG TPA: PIN domain-containing protein [Limnobacter sp.]|nr:PIN domain-containing protein [Limnobacter sp.]
MSVLVDTSVWVGHFKKKNPRLTQLLLSDLVLVHPFVLGEIACGTPPNRAQTLLDLKSLAYCKQATLEETIQMIGDHQLYGEGCGLVDLSLLASALITPQCLLWTQDRRLSRLAQSFGVGFAG